MPLINGEATIRITLNPGINGADIEVKAVVTGSHPSQGQQTAVQTYTIDDVPPTLTLDPIAAAAVGVPVCAAGGTTGLSPFDTNVVTCSSDLQDVSATPAAAGNFQVCFTYPVGGMQQITCTVADTCGQTAVAQSNDFEVF